MSKKQSTPSDPGKRSAKEKLPATSLAPTPLAVPDFTPDAFVQVLTEATAASSQILKQLNAVNKACDAAKKADVLNVLATSDFPTRVQVACRQLSEDLPQYLRILATLKTHIDEWASAEKRSRRARFEQYVRASNWTMVGSWPEPVVESVVFVVVDEDKGKATVNGRQCSAPPTAERLIVHCAEELLRLAQNRTAPSEFVKQVWKAYQARGGQASIGVPVFDLLAEMVWQRQGKAFSRDPRTELFKGYGVAQFRADLTHCLAAGPAVVTDGSSRYRLELVGGSFAQDGLFMFMPQSQRLATCGRVIFKPVESGE